MKRPNVLWICSDQQRFDTLGCYGNEFVHTPYLDDLAQSGVLFERSYCQSPLCTPSRASFLTGRYPRTTRTRQNGQAIPVDEVLVTRLLANAGYNCGLAGKLHLAPVDPEICRTTEPRTNDGYAELHWSPQADPWWPTNEYFHWLRERGVPFQRSPFRGSKYVEVSMPAEHHQTAWCAQKAINFIEANAAFDQPWLFSVNFLDPHHPFDPPLEYLERYLDRLEDIPLPNYKPGELDSKPVFQRVDHRAAYGHPGLYPFPEMTDEDHRLIRAAYWAMVDLIDDQVGQMLAALERTGQLDNTIVIFMSDHGEMLGDHGIYLKGPYLYEPAVRVPLIIAWPSIIEGRRRSEALVELVDVAPTLLQAAGLERYPGMQGHSLLPLLTGQVSLDNHRDDVYSECYNAFLSYEEPAAYVTMIRDNRYKLVAVHGLDTGELYDLEQDPAETVNRWDDYEYLPTKTAMLKRLCDRMAWTVDPLPERVVGW